MYCAVWTLSLCVLGATAVRNFCARQKTDASTLPAEAVIQTVNGNNTENNLMITFGLSPLQPSDLIKKLAPKRNCSQCCSFREYP